LQISDVTKLFGPSPRHRIALPRVSLSPHHPIAMNCPLCANDQSTPSWLGSTWYRGQEFPYVECSRCHSLFCQPMPDESVLRVMYGADYTQDDGGSLYVENPKEPNRVLEILKSQPSGTFVDFGCGSGELLVEAKKLGWNAIGVELDAEVAKRVAEKTGISVVTELTGPAADVLHLGDVIEHLTQLDKQFPAVLDLIKPGGLLLAQGPLENNASLFTLALSKMRQFRGDRRTEMAPYHVLLATSQGQREFFKRFGLEEVEYTLREVSWPAPVRLSLNDLKNPRTTAMFSLRKVSKAVSALRPANWGNRYFYAGRKVMSDML
jgi:SAM-dependent methyltransferase